MGEKEEGEAKTEEEKVAAAEAEATKHEEMHQKAEMEYEDKKQDLDKIEADMKEASKRLRKFRHDEDSGGGVSYEKPCKKPANPTPALPPCESGAALSFKLPAVFVACV